MVRSVYSPEYCLQYLEQYASKEVFVIGLILGQTTTARDNVIHLARTPEEKQVDNVSENTYSVDMPNQVETVRTLLTVSEAWVADHAKHVTRMLPGGMFVQGIFVTSEEDVFEDPNCFSKVKSILNHVYKAQNINQYMYGNCPYNNERLVLHMSTSTKVLNCKSVEVGTGSKSTVIKPVEWKFLPKPQQWQRLDCYYEFDDVYPVIVKNCGISVKQQFQQILESAHKTIESSIIFIDGELKDGSELLEQLYKKKKPKNNLKTVQQEPPKSMNISIFLPFENTMPETVEYLECDGSIHFSGIVSSSVFMYPKATVSEAIAAVKQDIVRSLASRFTMHCDALIDDNLLPEEKVCFNEPPRRVLVPVGSLYLCDYLFPGEAPAEALLSVRELLDLQITETDVVCDLETPADTSEFDALDRDASSEELLATPQVTSQFIKDGQLAGSGSLEPEIGFKLALHPINKTLYVTVIGARHLPSLFGLSRAHGYLVKVKIFPGDSRFETSLQESSWPVWNEDFKFQLKQKDVKKSTEKSDLQSLLAGHFLSLTIYALLEPQKPEIDKRKNSRIETAKNKAVDQDEPKSKTRFFEKTFSSFKSTKAEAMANKTILEKRRTVGAATWNFDSKLFQNDLKNGLTGTPDIWRPINAITSGIAVSSHRENKKGQLEVTLLYTASEDGLDDIVQLTVNRLRCSVQTMQQQEQYNAPLYLKATILEANKAECYWKSDRFAPTISARWEPKSSTVKLSVYKVNLNKVSIYITLGCKTKMAKKENLGKAIIDEKSTAADSWKQCLSEPGVPKTFWVDFE
ncbi:unnamed protein product [Arctia plantaginis]|uniref:C2 domain-containing protein n=1 Tax=Arctia plantaginis TaxID=874455 RepID=A0A8S0YQE7_ARCPL|nr:unnamed protein product [Arctia plantaginis]